MRLYVSGRPRPFQGRYPGSNPGSRSKYLKFVGIAQVEEHLSSKQGCEGSSPSADDKIKGYPMRTFLEKPMSEIGIASHADEISLDEFVADTKKDLDAFLENMKNLNKPEINKEKFPEKHMELFLAWDEFLED